jgi:hypothetical protein
MLETGLDELRIRRFVACFLGSPSEVPEKGWIRLRNEAEQADRATRHGRDYVTTSWLAALTAHRALSQL